jgi:hypothetical protein
MRRLALAVVFAAVAVAQQPAKPAPLPAPRWPDGRVNLGSAPGQKGYWEIRPGGSGSRFPRAADVPMQPWARALYEYRQSAVELYPPLVGCKPAGGPGFFNSPGFEIVDVPELQRIFILNIAGAHSWRVIYMDGRAHPPKDKLRPTYLGHSIGRWEGDTLVIDTVGFNEKQWIQGAYPTTGQLHLVERISRPNLGTLVYDVTIDDPGAYTAPWSGGWTNTSWIPDGEMFEYICQNARETK